MKRLTTTLLALLVVACASPPTPAEQTLGDFITESLLLQSDCESGRKTGPECHGIPQHKAKP